MTSEELLTLSFAGGFHSLPKARPFLQGSQRDDVPRRSFSGMPPLLVLFLRPRTQLPPSAESMRPQLRSHWTFDRFAQNAP